MMKRYAPDSGAVKTPDPGSMPRPRLLRQPEKVRYSSPPWKKGMQVECMQIRSLYMTV